MDRDWDQLFDHYGIKIVSKTDRTKGAYLPNATQRRALAAAGFMPSLEEPHPVRTIEVLFDPEVATVEASYYHSKRSKRAKRQPEPRMGHSLISGWLQQGDRVVFGNVGSAVFVAKIDHAQSSTAPTATELATKLSGAAILARARAAKGPAARRSRVRDDFVRNPFVVAAALIRANGTCEKPACGSALFETDRGAPYLEVHHVVPLGEGGHDAIENVAALCPHCHRELHFGKDRGGLRMRLEGHLAGLPPL